MDDNTKLGKTLGQVGSLANKAGKALHQVASDTKKAAKQQTGIAVEPVEAVDAKNQDQEPNLEKLTPQQPSQQTKDIVAAFYAKTDPKLQTPSAQTATAIAEENPEKTPDEIKKMADLKLQLHMEKYYNPTFNPPKQQEEAPAERIERLEKEEEQKRWELQQKEEKKKPVLPGPKKTAETRVGAG